MGMGTWMALARGIVGERRTGCQHLAWVTGKGGKPLDVSAQKSPPGGHELLPAVEDVFP
jgi:hypothetical protein